MRSYKLVQYMEQLGKNIQTIIEYLSLNKEHFVTYAIVDPFGKTMLENNISMSDNGKLINTISFPDGEKMESTSADVTFEQFQAIVSYVKKQNPSKEYKDTFSDKWEEIVKVTSLNVGHNKMVTYR